MHWLDWAVIGLFFVVITVVGLVFSRRAGTNTDAFFVSGRSLKWYVAGISLISTGFACDTPLWVGALVRQYGVQAVWQYWCPLIGVALAAALFSRLVRRTGKVTENEILEMRYSGRSAGLLRGASAAIGALILCPLIMGWVAKAMVTITEEVIGTGGGLISILGVEMSSEKWITIAVMGFAVILCACSGLYGVVYTDLIQFCIATVGTFVLAWMAVREVGGMTVLLERLSTLEGWPGQSLSTVPEIAKQVHGGNRSSAMSVWNAIGFFGILWWGNALCGGYMGQRVLACKDTSHASRALTLHAVIYFGVICWPWILVALASLILLPDLGGAGHDAAYPRMLMLVLPAGLRGLMISAMLAAFISTVSTLLNWGSSYIVNDMYRRFVRSQASDRHYVRVSRWVTVGVAIVSGFISLRAHNIQELLSVAYVASAGMMTMGVCRWCWWRTTAAGELAALVVTWVGTAVMLFGHLLMGPNTVPLLDRPMGWVLGLDPSVSFTLDYALLGARMFLAMSIAGATVVGVSLATRPSEHSHLQAFVRETRIFVPGWRAITQTIPGYEPAQLIREAVLNWVLIAVTVASLIFANGLFMQMQWWVGGGLFAVFTVLLWVVIARTRTSSEETTTLQGKQGSG